MILSALLALVRRALAPEPDGRAGTGAAASVVGPAATFAPTSFARARLLRQAHASGLFGACPAEDPPLRAG